VRALPDVSIGSVFDSAYSATPADLVAQRDELTGFLDSIE
jgi:hypothetical protein